MRVQGTVVGQLVWSEERECWVPAKDVRRKVRMMHYGNPEHNVRGVCGTKVRLVDGRPALTTDLSQVTCRACRQTRLESGFQVPNGLAENISRV